MKCHVVVNMGRVERVIQLEVCKECEFGSLPEFGEIPFYDMLEFCIGKGRRISFWHDV